MKKTKRQTKKKLSLHRMSDEELKQFVLGVADGRIFLSSSAPDNMLRNIFLPLALGAVKNYSKKELENVAMIWECRSKRLPWTVNSRPIFTSCYLMHKDDWNRASKAIEEEVKRRAAIKV